MPKFKSRMFACLLLLGCLPQNFVSAGLVLTKSEYSTQASGVIQQARELVAQNEYDQARDLLRKLRTDQKDMLAGDVLLFEMLSQQGKQQLAKRALEQFSVESKPSFDIFYAFSRLAILEQRWFDAFMHAQLALNQEMPADWSEDFQAQMRLEANVVLLESCEGRGSWQQCSNILTRLELTEDSDTRLIAFAGKTAFHSGDAKRARGYFSSLKSRDASAALPDTVLARLHNAAGDLDAANQSYLAAVAVAAKTSAAAAPLKLEYANWLLANNRPDDAKRVILSVKDQELRDDLEFCLGSIQLMQGDLNAAAATLGALDLRKPDALPVRNHLALALSNLKSEAMKTKAFEIAEQNAQQYPNVSEVWSTLGWTQMQLGQLDVAEKSFANAIKSGVINRDTAYFLSEMHRAAGREKEAAEFRTAAQQGKGAFYFGWKLGDE